MRLWEFPKPIIGAINGWAMGAGSWFALFTHITSASENAVFAQPEVRHGSNTSFMWTLLGGFKNALRYGLTGDHVDAQEARVAAAAALGKPPLDVARAAERALTKKGARLGPLHGVPFSTKDLVITRGIRTTFGTPLYAHNVPTEDAPMVERLKAAGAIQLGKTNTPAFGWIGATHNLLFGITRNPWNLDRTPGGSSGGASAAVAAGLGPLAIGTDGGGSIRIPSAFCGTVGLRPVPGRVPVYPSDFGWDTLVEHVHGPMTRTVEDCALMLQPLAGHGHSRRQRPDVMPGEPLVDHERG